MTERAEGHQPEEALTLERVNNLNSDIWESQYRQDKYAEAEQSFTDLKNKALEQGIDSEVIAGVIANLAWSQYRDDDVSTPKKQDNRSWITAKEGLTLLKIPETDHETRSRLLEVAGLCQLFLVNEQDEAADSLLRQALEEAQHYGEPSQIGESTNGFGLLFFGKARAETDTDKKKEYYQQSIPYFQDAARIHEEAQTQGQRAGHPYNNLIECYNNLGIYEQAIGNANMAFVKYNDTFSPHSFSARFRKSLSWRGLGVQTRNELYFNQALAIYEVHKELRFEQGRQDLAANEDQNIETTRQEMQEIFGQKS